MYGKIITMALSLGLLGGYQSYKHEANKDKLIPLAFSEISQMERQSAELGMETPNITSYLAKTNDLTMKVFEAWNESWGVTTGIFSNQTDAFISELNKKVDPVYKEHKYEIPHLAVTIPSDADSVLNLLKDFKDLKKDLKTISSYLGKTWDDYHDDEYHTEIYYTTSTDSDGNTTTEMHTRQVYDYTDNKYVYHRDHGDKSSQLMDMAKQNFNDIKLKETFMTANNLGDDNIKAMNESRKEMLEDGKKLSEAELKDLSSMWLHGSTIYNNALSVYSRWWDIKRDADKWRTSKNTAKSYTKRTYNYSHAESNEFLTSEGALKRVDEMIPILEQTLVSVGYTKTKVPELYKKIKTAIENQDNDKFDKKKAKKEILALSREIYKTNFNKGFDVQPSEFGWVALWSFLGILAGSGLGYGLDYVMGGKSRNREYGRYY